eukprot:358200-Chlamydomonas_euryale.AAC.1
MARQHAHTGRQHAHTGRQHAHTVRQRVRVIERSRHIRSHGHPKGASPCFHPSFFSHTGHINTCAHAPKQRLVRLRALVEHSRVDRSCEQVVGGGDGMDVAGQVQVELLHGDDLQGRKGRTKAGVQTGGEQGRRQEVGRGADR